MIIIQPFNLRSASNDEFALLNTHKKRIRLETDPLVPPISVVEHSLLHKWQAQAVDRATGFDPDCCTGAFPEEQIEAMAALYGLINQQPFGELDREEVHFMSALLRQMEQDMFSHGVQRWVMYIIERATGKFAGYTEVNWNPQRPAFLEQGMTGVFPEYRNRGLGRWLKAAMLEKVLHERPEVEYNDTGNADANAAILKINNKMGSKPNIAWMFWEVSTDKVRIPG